MFFVFGGQLGFPDRAVDEIRYDKPYFPVNTIKMGDFQLLS